MKKPIHPMIVHFPIVGWMVTFGGDIYQYFGNNRYADIIELVVISSCVLAVISMAAGLVDYLRQKPEEAIARHIENHMYWALALFMVFTMRALLPLMLSHNLLLWSLMCSFLGFVVLIYTAWLGGHLVYSHGVGQAEAFHTKKNI